MSRLDRAADLVGPEAGDGAARARRTEAARHADTTAPALELDPIACVGHGLCAELFPEGIVLDDWGFPILLEGAGDPALRQHARRAAKACPALALRLRGAGR
jgi:ferredoxin